MAHISLRVSNEEKGWMESYAQMHGLSLSDAIKQAFFEKLENEYDIRLIKEFEQNDDGTRYSLNEVKEMLGIADDIQS